jgi:hypothetical protein
LNFSEIGIAAETQKGAWHCLCLAEKPVGRKGLVAILLSKIAPGGLRSNPLGPWGARDCSGNPAGLAKQDRGIGAESPVFCGAKNAHVSFRKGAMRPLSLFFSF